MKKEPFVIERTYNASIAKIWKAITDKDDMKQWYFDLAEFKPEVGFEFQFSGGTENNKYLHLCKIIEVVPGKKLTYSWRYDGYEGNSFVTFELFEDGNKTRLKLTHESLETFPASNLDFAKENFAAGWTQIIGTSLKEFAEKITV
ncbi:MAG: SRPBCC domain-containing protein [Bacteroidia bacterium]